MSIQLSYIYLFVHQEWAYADTDQFVVKEKNRFFVMREVGIEEIYIGKELQPLHHTDFKTTTLGILRDNDMVKVVLHNEELQTQPLLDDSY